MQRQRKRAPPRKRSEVAQMDEDGFGVTALLEYLKAGAVSELTIVEVSSGTYRLEALLTWRAGRSALSPREADHASFASSIRWSGF